MKRIPFWMCVICLMGVTSAVAQTEPQSQTPTQKQQAAQPQASASMPGHPPKVLTIFREEVKVGKGPAHEKFEAGFVQASRKAKWPTHYLAMTSMSGTNEAWFITPYDSFEAWEQDTQATEKNAAFTSELDQLGEKDAEFINSGRNIVAVYRDDLSYHANEMKVPEARYMEVEVVRVRLGEGKNFADMEKMGMAAHDKANTGEHWACYEVVEGMPAGTYLFFSAMKSLKQADVDNSKAVMEAMGEENVAKRRKFAKEGIAFVESNLFQFRPKMSYASDQWIAANPEFWAPKAEVAGKSATGSSKPASARTKQSGAKVAPASSKEQTNKQKPQ